MRIYTLKKIVAALCFSFAILPALALDHGSIKGSGVQLYDQGNPGGNTEAPKDATIDYKIVTIGGKTWAWIKVDGPSTGAGADWMTQLRYWTTTNGKTENNLATRNTVSGVTKEVWGSTVKAIPSPVRLSLFCALDPGGNAETLLIDYDPLAHNSADAGDNENPVITSATASNVGPTNATLTFAGNDNSGDLFYYIKTDGIEEISFRNTYELTGLAPGNTYSVTVTPIDFSGNEGTSTTVQIATEGLTQITSGVAKEIKVVFKSTATELEYYYEFTDPAKQFEDAFIKITPDGGAEFEIKPTISPDGKYAYGKTNDARLANKVITLNCGYLVKVGDDPVWENYVIENKEITEGVLAGKTLKHKMGDGISESEKETVVPVFSNATLVDVTADYILINLDANDNSGTVYYEISGAKQTVNAFRTGDYYLTAIDAGKVYDLNIVAKDLSGNSSEAKQVKAKTMNARSNISDGRGMNYNSLVLPATGGELVSVISQAGSTLTLGCTTASDIITSGDWRNRMFNRPTISINDKSYDLILDDNKTTATIELSGQIGEGDDAIVVEEGTVLTIKWSVYWGETGGGQFFTGTFTYRIGDYGQEDADAPTAPVLTLSGTNLTWSASKDMLSGVKYYEVTEEEQAAGRAVSPAIIFDLGQESFSYTLSNATNKVTVTAYDFAGNSSSSSVNDGGPVGVGTEKEVSVSVYPNPATDAIHVSKDVTKVTIYSLSGQEILSVRNSGTIQVAHLAKGLYILVLSDDAEVLKTVKLAKQ